MFVILLITYIYFLLTYPYHMYIWNMYARIGTTSVAHLEENLAARDIELTPGDLQQIEDIFRVDAPVGERYPGNHMTFHEN